MKKLAIIPLMLVVVILTVIAAPDYEMDAADRLVSALPLTAMILFSIFDWIRSVLNRRLKGRAYPSQVLPPPGSGPMAT